MSPNNLPPSKPNLPSVTSDRVPILGLPLDRLSRAQTLECASGFLSGQICRQIVTLNTLMVLEAERSEALFEACHNASLVTADSSGITWAASHVSGVAVERYPGIDLAFDLCRVCSEKGEGVFLLGGAPGIAQQAALQLRASFPGLKVLGVRDGFFREEQESDLLREMASSGARLFLIGLGMPKQELWIHRILKLLPGGVAMGIGGSLDVWAGNVRRAPYLCQRLGVEWLYRLWHEPFRWIRIVQLPRFALKIVLERKFPRP